MCPTWFFFDLFDFCRVSPSAFKDPFFELKRLDGGRGRTGTRSDSVNSLISPPEARQPSKGRWEVGVTIHGQLSQAPHSAAKWGGNISGDARRNDFQGRFRNPRYSIKRMARSETRRSAGGWEAVCCIEGDDQMPVFFFDAPLMVMPPMFFSPPEVQPPTSLQTLQGREGNHRIVRRPSLARTQGGSGCARAGAPPH